MERMHVYKDAAAKGKSNELTVGAFCYPILMAVDIILYDTDFVPVGQDQKQHVEYARDITTKFNQKFGDVFTLPEPYIQEEVAVVPGIDGRKMSKSYNNYLGLLDEEAVLIKKIKRIATAAIPVEDPKNPDECNLYKIYKLFLDKKEDAELRKRYLA
jgi:tryptophanyl-tRNA synthetase